jgi:hypothetical protein
MMFASVVMLKESRGGFGLKDAEAYELKNKTNGTL